MTLTSIDDDNDELLTATSDKDIVICQCSSNQHNTLIINSNRFLPLTGNPQLKLQEHFIVL